MSWIPWPRLQLVKNDLRTMKSECGWVIHIHLLVLYECLFYRVTMSIYQRRLVEIHSPYHWWNVMLDHLNCGHSVFFSRFDRFFGWNRIFFFITDFFFQKITHTTLCEWHQLLQMNHQITESLYKITKKKIRTKSICVCFYSFIQNKAQYLFALIFTVINNFMQKCSYHNESQMMNCFHIVFV